MFVATIDYSAGRHETHYFQNFSDALASFKLTYHKRGSVHYDGASRDITLHENGEVVRLGSIFPIANLALDRVTHF